MCPKNLTSQRGAGLPVALFIITVLALLVAGMAQQQQSSGESVSLQIQSQRAFFAGESGAQVGVARVLDNPAQCPSTGASWSINFTQAALSDCEASVTCTSSSSGSRTVYTLTSRGQCGVGSPEQTERIIRVRFR